jgi:hypothetical protein
MKVKLRLQKLMRLDAICKDCGVDTAPKGRECECEYYMVHDKVWSTAGMKKDGGFLCIGCLENRLGRELTAADFTSAPVNNPHWWRHSWRHSERLENRLGRYVWDDIE